MFYHFIVSCLNSSQLRSLLAWFHFKIYMMAIIMFTLFCYRSRNVRLNILVNRYCVYLFYTWNVTSILYCSTPTYTMMLIQTGNVLLVSGWKRFVLHQWKNYIIYLFSHLCHGSLLMYIYPHLNLCE